MIKFIATFILTFVFIINQCNLAFAGNLRIKNGAKISVTNAAGIDLNTNTATTGMIIEAGGEFDAGNGAVNLTGDWNNAGTFTPGSSTVTFDSATADQNITSGGDSFYDLVLNNIAGSGSDDIILQDALDVDRDVTLTDGDLTTNGNNITVAQNWDNSAGAASLTAGTDSVTFDTSLTSYLSGNTTFHDLVSNIPSKQITIQANSKQTITNTLTLDGQAGGTEIKLRSSSDGTRYELDVTNAPQSVEFVDVKDSNVSTNDITATNSLDSGNNDNGEISPHWVFGAATRYWVGAIDGDWDNSANWATISGGAGGANYPTTGDTAIFDGNSTNNCVLDADVNAAIISLGAAYTGKLDANGYDITVSSTCDITAGELELDTNSDLIVNGILTINGGVLDAVAGTIDTNSDVALSSGTLTAPSGDFNIAGDFTVTGGTFNNSSGTVTLDGAAAQSITNNAITYNNLIVTNASAGGVTFNDAFTTANFIAQTASTKLIFKGGATYTITGDLTLNGQAIGTEISLRSTDTNNYTFDIQAQDQTVSYIDVAYCSSDTNDIFAFNSVNSGNNDNAEAIPHWVFVTLAITSPEAGTTVDTTPTVVGTAGPNDTVTIKDKDSTVVATTTSDEDGNFRVELTTELATGANSLTPFVGAVSGTTINLTVDADPSPEEVPVINVVTDQTVVEGVTLRVRGATPAIGGQGSPGATVVLTASDEAGNLDLTEIATTTVDANGDYAFNVSDYTTSLVKGKNYITVTINGVVSGIIELIFIDPFGIVFDSVSNNPISNATVTLYYDSDLGPGTNFILAEPGVHFSAIDTNPQTTDADGAYSYLVINGDYYMTVEANGYTYPSVKSSFPSGRTIVTGAQQETFTVFWAILEIDMPMDPQITLFNIFCLFLF